MAEVKARTFVASLIYTFGRVHPRRLEEGVSRTEGAWQLSGLCTNLRYSRGVELKPFRRDAAMRLVDTPRMCGLKHLAKTALPSAALLSSSRACVALRNREKWRHTGEVPSGPPPQCHQCCGGSLGGLADADGTGPGRPGRDAALWKLDAPRAVLGILLRQGELLRQQGCQPPRRCHLFAKTTCLAQAPRLPRIMPVPLCPPRPCGAILCGATG